MARKKNIEEHENHERWLVSYADFITLLFSFFVVMYSISSINEGKYRVFSDSLGNAFHGELKAQPSSDANKIPLPIIARSKDKVKSKPLDMFAHERKDMTKIADDLLKVLAPLVRGGQVRVTQNALGVSIEINASVLFSPAEAKLSDESGTVLKALAKILKNDSHHIEIEGHTDNIKIVNSIFPSNWELSSSRASSVARLFSDSGIIDQRMTVIGSGANKPVENNATIDNRARNRRVTVLIVSSKPASGEEVSAP